VTLASVEDTQTLTMSRHISLNADTLLSAIPEDEYYDMIAIPGTHFPPLSLAHLALLIPWQLHLTLWFFFCIVQVACLDLNGWVKTSC
jgi:hypothetical protein